MGKRVTFQTHDQRIRRSLRYSVGDGMFHAIMVGFGESFFGAYALFLKANNVQLGLISALPQALGAIAQLFALRLMRILRSRKAHVLINAILQALMFIPIVLAYYLGELRVWHLLAFLCLFWVFSMLISPAWSSWMGDLVPTAERGRYFGMRNRFTGLASLLALLAGGLILAFFEGSFAGFAAVFLLAMASRLVSVFFLSMKYDPGYTPHPGASFSLREFLLKARYNNFGIFVLFLTFMNFSVYLAAPFFTAYMLRDLQMDYWTFTLITAVPLVVKFVVMGAWGRASDRFGTRKVLTLNALLIPLVPILWLFDHSFWYLILIQVVSGFVWGGFELAAFNFIFDCTSVQKRPTAVAYYNLLNGLAMLGGAFLGGMIVRYEPAFFWSKYYFVFLLSGVARFVVAVIFIPRIHEMRHVEKASYTDVLASLVSPSTMLQHKSLIVAHEPKK